MEREFAATPPELAAAPVNWLDDAAADAAGARREALLAAAGPGIRWTANGTKMYGGELAPGCRACVAGSWSCLFVCGACNGACFFCPTPQDAPDELPTSGSLTWRRPEDFAAYVGTVGVAGVGISGGEPLLVPERALAYVRTLRARCPDVHLWLYTNGLLGTRDIFAALAAAGLGELRFNLCAGHYRLDAVRAAAGTGLTLTVEIPAIPEDEARLRDLLPELVRLGVRHLNLHQLRLTPHNVARLAPRGYHYLPGSHPLAVESEETALRLLAHVLASGLDLGVNLCTFPYKHAVQAAGARRRAAAFVRQPDDVLTPTGHLRRCRRTAAGWQVDYVAATIVDALSYRHPFRALPLPGGPTLYVESRAVVRGHRLTDAEYAGLEAGRPPADLAAYERP